MSLNNKFSNRKLNNVVYRYFYKSMGLFMKVKFRVLTLILSLLPMSFSYANSREHKELFYAQAVNLTCYYLVKNTNNIDVEHGYDYFGQADSYYKKMLKAIDDDASRNKFIEVNMNFRKELERALLQDYLSGDIQDNESFDIFPKHSPFEYNPKSCKFVPAFNRYFKSTSNG
ncbi:TPA: hypothetical protein I7765_21170 [Vibrio vulnificus]|nr:hypothetical protein [Vibrio vulnificus]HAS8429798.1 hypothetical protein [Vibrio vulnificus]